MNIGKKIKSLRCSLGITQLELANYLSISHQSVSKWEKEVSVPSVYYIVPIAKFFKISISELFEENAYVRMD